jgi:hypothetical protein
MARKDDEKSYLMGGELIRSAITILLAMRGLELPMNSEAEKMSGDSLNRCERKQAAGAVHTASLPN